jgi:hypothetical protein
VIIFGSVRFLYKKSNQTDFKKKPKPNRNRFKPTGFGSVFLAQNQFKLVWLGFFPVFFGLGFGSVRFFRFQAYKTETEPNRSVFSKF